MTRSRGEKEKITSRTYRTAGPDAGLVAPLDAIAQERHGMAVIRADAAVQGLEVNAVLERAILDQAAVRDGGVFARQAHGEAQIDLRVRIEVRGAELDHVTQTLGRAVFALDAVVRVRGSVSPQCFPRSAYG